MKKLFCLITIALKAFELFAQKTEMAQAVIHYDFSHTRDTTKRDVPYKEKMILFLGPTASVYKSYDKKLQDAMMRKQAEEQIAAQKGTGQMMIRLTANRPTTRAELFQYPSQHKLYRTEQLFTTKYLIEDPLPKIDWKISGDTSTFGTLHCQKATGYFGGRNYTAWFCPDLPYHVGPWKLNGLPGLIVEAYDTNKEVVFKFDGVEEVIADATAETTQASSPGQVKIVGLDPNQNPNLIALPTDAAKTTDKEYSKLQEAIRKDPQAFMGSAMGSGMRMIPPGGTPTAPSPGMPQAVSVTALPRIGIINNPLELPEKK